MAAGTGEPAPYAVREWNGRSVSLQAACPGVWRSVSPCMTATNLSVVGSGPTCAPGTCLPVRYWIIDVFPVLYCPSSSTIGAARKSAFRSAGVANLGKLYFFSSGTTRSL